MRRNRNISPAVLIVMLCCSLGSAAFEAKDVKVIQMGWGMPDIVYVQTHIAEMEETHFDGIVLTVLEMDGREGSRAMGQEWFTPTWNIGDYDFMAGELARIQFRRFTHSMLVFGPRPGYSWFAPNNPHWNYILNNIELLAQYAKDAGIGQLLFDPEYYASEWINVFDYDDMNGYFSDGTLEQYQAQVKSRAGDIMDRIENQIPSVELLLLMGYWLEDNNSTYSSPYRYDVYSEFIDGFLAAANADSRIYDGWEASYYIAPDDAEFIAAYEYMTETSRSLAQESVRPEFDDHYRTSFACWPDMGGYDPVDFSNNHLDPEEFARFLQLAANYSDRYVWVYNADMKWWATGDVNNAPQAYRDALDKFVKEGRLERFDKVTKDPATWEEYASVSAADTVITQNYAITLNAAAPEDVDYTTVNVTAGLGDSVSVEVTPASTGGSAVVGLLLTNDSGANGAASVNDSRQIGLLWQDGGNEIIAKAVGSGGTQTAQLRNVDHGLGVTYIYEIQRLALGKAAFRVFDIYRNQLGSSEIVFEDLPQELCVSLVAYDSEAEFDSVWIDSLTCEELKRDGENLAGDVNGDCAVDLNDFSSMANNWMVCVDPENAGCLAPWE